MKNLASNLPARLGDPCWTPDGVGRAIASIARLSAELEPYFIATHAPNARLRDWKNDGYLSEREVYERLLSTTRANVFAIVRGDPGTGKSHLIRWLHLRCTLDIKSGKLPSVLPVLVQRRNGSLKDALLQIVEQLPPRFARHLHQINEAIGNLLSEDRARHALAGALQLQLVDANNVPPTLRQLHEACLSPDFRRWLIRSGGVIDRIVRQLTQESDTSARESLPTFTPEEFLPGRAFHDNNAPSTKALIEDLEYLPELRDQAASLFNAASRPAVKVMSGLIGSGLRDVFDAIRKELREEGKRLALFIEDVSVMASLDEDILNAVEPNPDPMLGELVAVVGMTETGFKRLPENLVGRTTDIIGVGLDTAANWLANADELAGFSARYLNVARLTQRGVNAVAADRHQDGDVGHSACSVCPVQNDCHPIFGAVSFDGVDVGLFPFTETALHTLFGSLNEGMPAVRRNPRGLLEHILTPVLRDDRTALLDHTFPRGKLAVEIDEPAYWSAFVAKYLGGWSIPQQTRLRALAQAWIRATVADEAATSLQPFLAPLAFPHFSEAADLGEASQPPTPASNAGPPGTEMPTAEPELLRVLRNDMRGWADGEPLENDVVPRDLLIDLLKNAVGWDEQPLSVRVYDKFLKSKSYLRFEGQRSRVRVGQVAAYEVKRGEAARAMIEALGRWKWEGRDSWNFPAGQQHRRAAARWLRANIKDLVGTLLPPEPPGREAAVRHCVRILAAVAMLRRQSDHPPDRAGVVRELLRPLPIELPAGVNTLDERAMSHLWTAHPRALDFLLGELNAPQGGTLGGILYIDPRPVMAHADDVQRLASTEPLPAEYVAGGFFWQGPYVNLQGTEGLANFELLFDERRKALLALVAREVQPAIIDAGIVEETLESGVVRYCAEIAELLPVQNVNFPRAYPELDDKRAAFATRGRTWAQALAEAQRAATSKGVAGLLRVPVTTIKDAVAAISASHRFLNGLDADLRSSEDRLVAGGDPEGLIDEIRRQLRGIASSESGHEASDEGEII